VLKMRVFVLIIDEVRIFFMYTGNIGFHNWVSQTVINDFIYKEYTRRAL
jgi:hypothetical protein